jgi:HlyD family secretion protein
MNHLHHSTHRFGRLLPSLLLRSHLLRGHLLSSNLLRSHLLRNHLLPGVGVALLLAFLQGCGKPAPDRVQGYVEGEFVYVASPLAGQLETLSVDRGSQVTAGQPLFALDNRSETDARDQAARLLAEAQANLEDATKGKRPTEIQSMQAQLDQARAALAYSETELARVTQLRKTGAVSQSDYDQDLSTRDQNKQKVAQLEADLKTGEMGQRDDLIQAAEQEVKARQAALAQATWNLSQKHQDAPKSGLIFDVLYRPGEWVDAGRPVISLLPPENIKVRAFVSEARIGSIRVGDSVQVIVDGVAPFAGKVSFISPNAEYTPPVIYSQESRDKLVFMIEIVFDADTAARLHPGQPVDVLLGSETSSPATGTPRNSAPENPTPQTSAPQNSTPQTSTPQTSTQGTNP